MTIRNSAVAYPLLTLCCVACIVFAIAVTIVLALIPIYLPDKMVTSTNIFSIQREVSFLLNVSSTTPIGPLTDAQIAILLATLLSSQSSNLFQNGAVKIKKAEIVFADQTTSGRKRRQSRAKVLDLHMIVGGQSVIQVENLLKSLGTAVQQSTRVLDDTVSNMFPTDASSTVTTTIPAILLSSTTPSDGSERRRRRGRREESRRSSTQLPQVTYKD